VRKNPSLLGEPSSLNRRRGKGIHVIRHRSVGNEELVKIAFSLLSKKGRDPDWEERRMD